MSDRPKVIPLRRQQTDADRRAIANAKVRFYEDAEKLGKLLQANLGPGVAFVLMIFESPNTVPLDEAGVAYLSNAPNELALHHLERRAKTMRGRE